MKCPSQNHGQVYEQKGALPTEDWHLPSTPTEIKESQFLHLLIPRETLMSLMVTSPLAIKENFTIKSQNRVLSYGSETLGNNQVLLWV